MENNHELLKAIREFFQLLDQFPDEPQNVHPFLSFIFQFLKIKTAEKTLPTIEIMTILKHRKPIVHYSLRKQTNNPVLQIVTHLEMELEQAEFRLKQMLSDL